MTEKYLNEMFSIFERYYYLSHNPTIETKQEEKMLLDIIANNWGTEYFIYRDTLEEFSL